MTVVLVALLLVFGFGPAVLAFMGCMSVVDNIRVRRGLAPFGDSRTYPEIFSEIADQPDDTQPEGSPPVMALAA